MNKIADSGLIIAGLDPSDAHHLWARRILEREIPPWHVCEPVLAEISASIGAPHPVLEMLVAGDLQISFELKRHQGGLLSLVKKYRDQKMDLADACVVMMSDLLPDSVVYTVDKRDFSIYRRRGNRVIPCVFPA